MERAAAVVDVASVRLVVDRDHLGAERAEQRWRELARSAVGAVENEFHAREFRARNHASAQVLQVFLIERAIGRNGNPVRGRVIIFVIVNLDFEVFLDFVREFHSRSGEQFHAIVVKRIMRGGNHHAGRELVLPNQAGNARRADYARGNESHAVVGEPRSELRGNMRTRLARIHADQDTRLRVAFQ